MEDKSNKQETMDYLIKKYIETKDEEYIKRIINDNDKLLYFILKKCGIIMVDLNNNNNLILGCYTRDDIMGVAYNSLLKTINTYDESKGYTPTTLFSTIIRNDINMIRRKAKHETSNNFVSIYQSLPGLDNDDLTYEKMIEDKTITFEDDIENQVTFNQIMKKVKLTKRQQTILNEQLKGKTQVEIAKELNISQSYVSRVINNAIEKIKKHTK